MDARVAWHRVARLRTGAGGREARGAPVLCVARDGRRGPVPPPPRASAMPAAGQCHPRRGPVPSTRAPAVTCCRRWSARAGQSCRRPMRPPHSARTHASAGARPSGCPPNAHNARGRDLTSGDRKKRHASSERQSPTRRGGGAVEWGVYARISADELAEPEASAARRRAVPCKTPRHCILLRPRQAPAYSRTPTWRHPRTQTRTTAGAHRPRARAGGADLISFRPT